MNKSPFKFLDSYTKDDKNIFFGRDKETEELYQKVFESKVLLVYGVSGTGKSSLIHCGLANKFQESDWLPINIRRGANINESLFKSITNYQLHPDTYRDTNEEKKKQPTLKKLLRNLYLDNFKPIYLIFDQFEELFIFGSKPEREDFVKSVKTIVDSDLNCKFLFVIREEYLAGITEFEKRLPQIMQNRIRIEKMGRSNAVQAIEGPCKYGNINLEEGFSEALINKLSPNSAEVELTYLQVYLDKLYRSTEISPLSEPVPNNREEMPKAEGFTIQLIESFGDVKDLLGSFLDEQIDELENPDEGLTILKAFVSTKGTKRQITEEEVHDYALTLGKQIESDQLKSLIQKFISLRILRDKDENNRYELRHDALAAKIYEKITLVEKELLEVRQFIEHAYENYKRRKVLLNKTDLSYIAPYEDKIYFGKDLQEFLNRSKHEAEKAKRRKRILISTAAIILIVILSGFTWWALNEKDKARLNENKAIANNFNFIAKEVLETDPTKALRIAEHAYSLDTTNKEIYQNLLNIYYNYPICKRIFNEYQKALKYRDQILTPVCISPNGKKILTSSNNQTVSLWDLNGNLLQVFNRHNGFITSVCFSPDGKSILVGTTDATAHLWNLDGSQSQVFTGYASFTCFSPDGQRVLIGSTDKTASLWDIKGKLLQIFKGHNGGINSGSFSPDGETVLTASRDKTACLWDLNGNQMQIFAGHDSEVNSACFSPDGNNVLTASRDKTARLWDLDGNQLQVFTGYEYNVNSACFSPDGKSILTGSWDKSARLWDLNGNLLQVFKGHEDGISSVCFSPNGKTILTGSDDETARLWDLNGNLFQIFKGHEDWIYSVSFSPDGKTILTGSFDKTARLWDLNGNLLQLFKGHENLVNAVCFSPNGKTILTGSDDKTARLWDLNGNLFQIFKGHEDWIYSVSFSPDGKTILTGSFDKTARLWDLNGNLLQLFKGHENLVNAVCFSPNGKTLLTGSDDKSARLWDLNGNLLQLFKGHADGIMSVCFSPDGKSILTGSWDKSARLWDLNGNLLQLFKGHEDGIYSVCFSPNGKTILTGSDDKTARLWNLNGNLLQVFKGHEDGLSSVCFSPDGKSILTGSWDKTARLWDLNGNLLQIFKAYEDGIRSVCFSPNGKTILTGYLDKTALIWDLNGNHLQLFKGHEGGIISVCFSPDGKSILTGSADKTARLWDVRTSYEEFIILGEYAELSIRDKLEYGICDFDNVSKLKVVDDIFEAALFYFNNLNELSDINKKQNYLNNAEKLFDKISKDSIQIKHLLKYQKLLIIKYQEQADTKYIQKINDIHKQLIENDIPDDLLIIADAYLFIFNNSNLGDISEFDIFEKLIEICKKILDEKDVAKYINNRISEILSYVSSNLLLVDKFEQAKQAAFLAKQANPDNSFLYTKLALAYLLTDDWQKAKAVYVTWKDKSYIYNDNEKLMRDAFLEDLDALESKDITHPDFDQVRELLKEEKTENNE